jgi:hypothetical protein
MEGKLAVQEVDGALMGYYGHLALQRGWTMTIANHEEQVAQEQRLGYSVAIASARIDRIRLGYNQVGLGRGTCLGTYVCKDNVGQHAGNIFEGMYPKSGTRSSRIGQATLKQRSKAGPCHGALQLTGVTGGEQPNMD